MRISASSVSIQHEARRLQPVPRRRLRESVRPRVLQHDRPRGFHLGGYRNIPAGFRARETYVFSGSDQLEEIFEIAEPGKDFEVYSRSRLTRVK
jgi:hypothetical protein